VEGFGDQTGDLPLPEPDRGTGSGPRGGFPAPREHGNRNSSLGFHFRFRSSRDVVIAGLPRPGPSLFCRNPPAAAVGARGAVAGEASFPHVPRVMQLSRLLACSDRIANVPDHCPEFGWALSSGLYGSFGFGLHGFAVPARSAWGAWGGKGRFRGFLPTKGGKPNYRDLAQKLPNVPKASGPAHGLPARHAAPHAGHRRPRASHAHDAPQSAQRLTAPHTPHLTAAAHDQRPGTDHSHAPQRPWPESTRRGQGRPGPRPGRAIAWRIARVIAREQFGQNPPAEAQGNPARTHATAPRLPTVPTAPATRSQSAPTTPHRAHRACIGRA
jgi:hypothetical protein